jgi:hypothetical protein
MQFDVPKQFNCLRLVTRFARISVGNDGFNIHRHNELLRADQPGSANSFSFNAHGDHSSKKWTVTSLARFARAICDQTALTCVPSAKSLFNLDRRIRQIVGPLRQQATRVDAVDDLPFQNTAFVESLGGMLADEVTPCDTSKRIVSKSSGTVSSILD